MVPFGDTCDVAVLVDHVSAFAVRATAGLSKNDLTQCVPRVFWPASFFGQCRQPGDIAMCKHDTGSFLNFRCGARCLPVGDCYGDHVTGGYCRLDLVHGAYSPADQYSGSNPGAQHTAGKTKQRLTSRVGGQDCRKRQSSWRVKQKESCRASLLSSGLFWCYGTRWTPIRR